MNDESIRNALERVYVEGVNPHRSNPRLSQQLIKARDKLASSVRSVTGFEPDVRGPVNQDNHHLITFPMSKGIPRSPAELKRRVHPIPALYLTARICAFAPWLELMWLELGSSGGMATRETYSLLDSDVLERWVEAEGVALTAIEVADSLDLELLSEALLRTPAPSNWPTEFWMPEVPELRNYIFPGFFES